MKVYLVRHGNSAYGASSYGDPGLTELGVAQAQAAGVFLKTQGARPSLVLTSGYARAVETAQTIVETLASPTEAVTSPDFSPSGDPDTMRAILAALSAEEVLVVGHMCSIGELAQTLSPQVPSLFGNCTVVGLEYNGARWKLLWFKDCGAGVQI